LINYTSNDNFKDYLIFYSFRLHASSNYKESLFKSTFIYFYTISYFYIFKSTFIIFNGKICELVGECEPLKKVEEGIGMRIINSDMIDDSIT